MDEIYEYARSTFAAAAARTAELVGSLPDTALAIPGSEWTIREAAVHLAQGGFLYAGMVENEPALCPSLGKEEMARFSAQLIADIPETDPTKLAALIKEGAARFLDVTVGCSGNEQVMWHAGLRLSVTHLLAFELCEHLLHGYDMALATGRPWPIEAPQAALVLYGLGPAYGLALNPATATGHTAGYGITLRTGERFTVRFTDGEYSMESPDSGPVDCIIEADPVAFLLVASGRLSQWTAIALGLLEAGGPHPELALRFNDLFVFP